MILEDIEDFGAYIKTTRMKFGISQTYISKESGITRSIISNIENCKVKDTRLSTAIKIIGALNRGLMPIDLNELNKDV
ncbi:MULTISPECIES: helix-turn-helix domain-containing protein [unclassified Maribacter]|uniref:helix-turn-helix domain-containing protein n=1 Tax=unclassified Maribacter TaxID=2615042 RepID=UPI00257C943E|nr:helix-turn-helix transcriptional regulator [Maribacter sp. UBA4516]|tara:strand:- start:104 stop:337 length:234 start_codon:yes stop_codon:yes gene_type:complete